MMKLSPKALVYKKKVLQIFKKIKLEEKVDIPVFLPIHRKNKLLGFLRPVTESSMNDDLEIKLLSKWRKDNDKYFPAQFEVTNKGTKIWIEQNLINVPDRFLFMILTPSGFPIGHLGLNRFDYNNLSCEIDNVIRGEKKQPGIMEEALKVLINWTIDNLKAEMLTLEVFSDNDRAIKLYEKIGFREIKKIPLKKVSSKNRVDWIEDANMVSAKRYNTYMFFRPNA